MSPSQSTRQSKSTGPRTPEGKHRASLNALRHGLTGRVVVLPSEDLAAWQSFCAELMRDLAPETALERQYAQTFCDTQWRLNRIRSIEDSMLSLGHYEEAGKIDGGHPQIHAAFTNARVFRADSKAFVNLSLYEQRLQRTLKESLRQLRELQAARIAARQAAASNGLNDLNEKAVAAAAGRNRNEMKDDADNAAAGRAESRFVFSTPAAEAGIEPEAPVEQCPAGAERAPDPLPQAA